MHGGKPSSMESDNCVILNRGITFHFTKAVVSQVGVLWTGLQTNGDSDSKGAVVLVSQPCMPIAFFD